MGRRADECRGLVHRLFQGEITVRELLEKTVPARRQLVFKFGAGRGGGGAEGGAGETGPGKSKAPSSHAGN